MGKRDASCVHAAVAFSRSVLRHTRDDPDPSCGLQSALFPSAAVAAFHATVGMACLRITRVCGCWLMMWADRPTHSGDTKLPCHVAHASVALSGVSIAHIGGDKALLLWQGRTHGNAHQCAGMSGERGTVPFMDLTNPPDFGHSATSLDPMGHHYSQTITLRLITT